MDWIVDALHQSHADEKRFRRDALARLQDEQSKIQNRLDKLYDDRLMDSWSLISLNVRQENGDKLRSV
jgi:flagellar biosynthesis chaperone FliJ